MRRLLLCWFFIFAILRSNAQSEHLLPLIEQKKFNSLRDYDLLSVSSNDYDINYYRCNWIVDPAIRSISGSVTSWFTITSTTNNIVFDFDRTMTVDSILFRGSKIGF